MEWEKLLQLEDPLDEHPQADSLQEEKWLSEVEIDFWTCNLIIR